MTSTEEVPVKLPVKFTNLATLKATFSTLEFSVLRKIKLIQYICRNDCEIMLCSRFQFLPKVFFRPPPQKQINFSFCPFRFVYICFCLCLSVYVRFSLFLSISVCLIRFCPFLSVSEHFCPILYVSVSFCLFQSHSVCSCPFLIFLYVSVYFCPFSVHFCPFLSVSVCFCLFLFVFVCFCSFLSVSLRICQIEGRTRFFLSQHTYSNQALHIIPGLLKKLALKLR